MITVALSVYNVAQYVRAALDCIINQSYTDIEILCIDDASTDGTWDILAQYADQDSRIRLIRQERNYGLSVSRNLAIKEAKGEYILMLDGDDLFSPVMVEKAFKKAKETNADMVIWDYVSFQNENEIKFKCMSHSLLSNVSSTNKIQLLRRPAFSPSRLIKVSAIRSLGIHFPEGLTKQDIPVHWKLVTCLDRIEILPEYFLYYRVQPNSTSARKDASVFSLAYVMDIVGKQLRDDNLYDVYRDEYHRSRLSLLQGMYDCILPGLKQEALAMVKERLGEDEQAYISSPRNELSPRVRDFYEMLNGDRMALIRYRGIHAVRSIYRFFKKPMK